MTNDEKIKQISEVILEWDSKKGHDRCWYYPDLFLKIVDIIGLKLSSEIELPPRPEFEEGCRRYQDLVFEKE